MPKLGRRMDGNQIQYLYPNASVTKHAPFGTVDTPQQRLRIVAGRPVYGSEDGHYGTPRWAQSPEPVRSPKRATSRGTNPGTPLKLIPLSDKPNHINPAEIIQASKFYRSGVQDTSNSHLQLHSSEPGGAINHHAIIPPIGNPSIASEPRYVNPPAPSVAYHPQPQPHQAPTNQAQGHELQNFAPAQPPPLQVDLLRHLPKDGSYLPKQAISLSKAEELELRRMVRDDLDGYKVHKLKDLYLELTGFDSSLTGFVTYTDLGFALLRGQMALAAMNLRLVASMSVDEAFPGLVNYEKILSFISAALRNEKLASSIAEPIPQNSVEITKGSENPTSPTRKDIFFNPITQETEQYSPRSKRFPYGAGDNAKLLRLIEAALLESGQELNFDKIRNTFGRADRGRRGMFSREQIKALAYESNIPLQDSILNNIIDKLDTSNGQYNWLQFIEFMEKVQPMMTGLNIPESKRPTEYVKHFPTPTANWPQNKDSLLPQSPTAAGRPADHPPMSPQRQDPSRPPQRPLDPSPHRLGAGFERQDPSPRRPGANFEQLEQQHRQQASMDTVQREFNKLDSHYEQAAKKQHDETAKGLEPWFDRYMKLADALYMSDLDKNGHLTAREMEWLVSKYNDIYELGISSSQIKQAVQNTAENENRVPIDPVLKHLARR